MVRATGCCNPIRGEKIVGYISRGKGVSVHSASCSNVVNLMADPDRRIEVEWDSAGQDESAFTVRLAVQVEDKKGMVAAVSAKVAGMNTNIRSMEATTDDTRGRIDMTVEISDMKHLEKVIKSVKTVSGVLDVERVYRQSGTFDSEAVWAFPRAVLAVPIRVRGLGMRRRLRRERIEILETEVHQRAVVHVCILEEIEDVRRQAEAKGFELVGVRLLRVDPELPGELTSCGPSAADEGVLRQRLVSSRGGR